MTKPLTQAQLLIKFETALQNAAHPETAPRLASWGYNEAARATDLELLSQTCAARTVQQQEISEATVAHKAKAQARDAARSEFVVFQRFLRFAARRYPDLNTASTLGIQPLPKAESEFLGYTTALLDRIAAQPDIAAALATLGYGQDNLDQLRALLDVVSQANVAQTKEQGEAERATAAYTGFIEQVRLAYSYITMIAKEALKDDPQLIEIMGLAKVPS